MYPKYIKELKERSSAAHGDKGSAWVFFESINSFTLLFLFHFILCIFFPFYFYQIDLLYISSLPCLMIMRWRWNWFINQTLFILLTSRNCFVMNQWGPIGRTPQVDVGGQSQNSMRHFNRHWISWYWQYSLTQIISHKSSSAWIVQLLCRHVQTSYLSFDVDINQPIPSSCIIIMNNYTTNVLIILFINSK